MSATGKKSGPAQRKAEDLLRETIDRQHLKTKALHLFLTAIVVSLFIFAFSGERGALALYRKWQERRSLGTTIAELEQANARKKLQNERLATDPRAVETIAREQLDMIRPDEIMFVLPDEPAAADGPTPTAATPTTTR